NVVRRHVSRGPTCFRPCPSSSRRALYHSLYPGHQHCSSISWAVAIGGHLRAMATRGVLWTGRTVRASARRAGRGGPVVGPIAIVSAPPGLRLAGAARRESAIWVLECNEILLSGALFAKHPRASRARAAGDRRPAFTDRHVSATRRCSQNSRLFIVTAVYMVS